ncbi:MAG: thiamine phosphate synthase [Alphaproteobacteria bacterium]
MTLAKLAAQLKCASQSRKIKRAMPALWLLSDTLLLADPLDALRHLPPGSGFIFRHYDHPEREAMARILRRLCRQRRILFLLAGDWRMAVRLGADGAHFPEGLAHRARAMRANSPHSIITVAAHSAGGVYRAYKSGAEGVLLSPLFATQSHPGAAALGPVRFAGLASRARLPVIALGGISARNARRLKGSGAAGIAGVSGIV